MLKASHYVFLIMAAPKGNKFAGNRKGIPNKKTQQWEVFSKYMLNGGLKRFQRELETMEGKDYVHAMINLMEFFKPRLARSEMDLTTKGEKITGFNYIKPEKK